ncbi:MAG TPA: PEP/pyruvate-binding domain-containing protein [Pseudonocardia sp.]|nr:PEP/pyruvate-binding domain-containing protein [Pseudonocardia sp.]
MAVPYILGFDGPGSDENEIVGGKGSNLGRLTGAGFPVPPGFTVTTEAYRGFLAGEGIGSRVRELAEQLDPTDAGGMEAQTSRIRQVITEQDLPAALVEQIAQAYRALEPDCFVAVRSSGTAEDLAAASFAGLHDTYLDIQGIDEVVDAIKRCWASLWTARAASYRSNKGFGPDVAMAVVVQKMVPSEVSGVMFTANPLTEATDEIVINASWGLGEGIVSGITTPDEYTLHAGSLRVLRSHVGAKEREVVRNPETGRGTVAREVDAARSAQRTLTDDQAAELGALGRRVQEYYGGFPQDTEWGLADGQFYLLQSRAVTGVNFSWDEDADEWQWLPEAEADTVWTRALADEIWTGAITPLFYSVRGPGWTWGHEYGNKLWGLDDQIQARMWKYHKGVGYYNANYEKRRLEQMTLPMWRPLALTKLPEAWHDEAKTTKLTIAGYLKMQARCALLDRKHGVTTWWANVENWIQNRSVEAGGESEEQMRRFSDGELRQHVEKFVNFEGVYITDVWTGFFVHAELALFSVTQMIMSWYDGDNPGAITDVITGTPNPGATAKENRDLWLLAQKVRKSPELLALFEANEGQAFFDRAADTEAGRAWLAEYHEFVTKHGHRGHADRDIYFTRRAEDPAVDYRGLRGVISAGDSPDPHDQEVAVEARRKAAVEDVVENMRRKSFGRLRADLFLTALDYSMRFLALRDEHRYFVDRSTFTMKRGYQEISRRLLERGQLKNADDFYFLTKEELYRLLSGVGNPELVRAKIEGRKRNFFAVLKRDTERPMYLRHGSSADAELVPSSDEQLGGVLRGVPTSRGIVEGTARVVKELEEIGVVKAGEILITNSTDPGWTPVFLVISGIVLETGGLLAHGSLLAREYGFPAVQLPRAMKLIPDGARIRVDGDNGVVTVLDEDSPAEPEPEVVGAAT